MLVSNPADIKFWKEPAIASLTPAFSFSKSANSLVAFLSPSNKVLLAVMLSMIDWKNLVAASTPGAKAEAKSSFKSQIPHFKM